MTIKVEPNIPLPNKYPFSQMKVGDSFAVPVGILRSTVTISAMRYSRKYGGKFTVRQMPDKTLRCWRKE